MSSQTESPASRSPLNVGFIGLSTQGWASTALGPSLIHPCLRSTYTLAAVATTSEESAKASAAKWSSEINGEVKAFSSSTALLEEAGKDLDLVAVSVTGRLHKEVLLPVIRAKKDFFVEWPAGSDLEATKAIAEEAKRFGVRSVVGVQARQSPVINKVKEIIQSGKIGKVLSTIFVGSFPREPRLWAPEVTPATLKYTKPETGATHFIVPVGHGLDTFTYLLGDFTFVSATGQTHYPTATVFDRNTGEPTGEVVPSLAGPEHIVINGTLQSGTIASLTWQFGQKSVPGRLHLLWQIEGEEGSVRLESKQPLGAYFGYGDPELFVNGEKVEVEVDEVFKEQGPVQGLLTRTWAEYAKGDGVGRHATIEDAVRVKTLMDAIERSIATGNRIVL